MVATSTIEFKTNRSGCRTWHVGRFVFFVAGSYGYSLSPLPRLAVIRFSGNRGAKTLLLENFSPFSQIPLSDPCPGFVSAQLRIDKSVLYIFSCSFLGKLLDNPGCSIKKFVNAHCKTSCLSVLCSVSAGEPENVSVKIVYSPCFLLFGGSCELFTGNICLMSGSIGTFS